MSDAQMKITVGADVDGAISGFRNIGSSVDIANVSLQKAFELLDKVGNSLASTSDPILIEQYTAAAEKLEARIKELQAAAGNPIVPPIDPSPIDNADKSMLSFGGSTTKARVAFIDLGRAITEQGFSLRAIASNFTLFNPLLVVAAAGIGFLVKYLMDASAEEKELIKTNTDFQAAFGKPIPININVDEAKQALDQYNKILSDTIGNTTKETSQVEALVSRLQSGNLSRQQTVDVIKKLQEIAPDYFGKLDAEKAGVDQVTTAYNNYNNALVASIEAQIKIAELNDIVKQRLGAQQQNPQATKYINDQLSAGKSLDDIQKGLNADIDAQNKKLIEAGQANKGISDEMQKQILLSGQAPAGTTVLLSFLEQEKAILDSINNAPLKDLKVNVGNGPDPLQENISLLEQIKALKKEIETPSKEPIFRQEALALSPDSDNGVELLNAKYEEAVKKANDAIAAAVAKGKTGLADEIRDNIADLGTLIQQRIGQIKSPDLSEHIKFTLEDPTKLDGLDKVNEKIISEIEKGLNLKAITVKVPIYIENAIKDDKSLTDAEKETILKSIKENASKNIPPILLNIPIKVQFKSELQAAELEKFNQQLTNTLKNSILTGIDTLSEDIGNAIAGKKSPFASFLSFIGEALENVGKELIAYSGILDGIKLAFSSLNPAVALAAGVAAIILGSVIKADVQHSLGGKGFASGGHIDGPGTTTSDSIPIRASKGEFITNAAAVAKPGMLAMLHAINSGKFSVADFGVQRAYAAGGFIDDLSPSFTVSSTSLSRNARSNPGRSPMDVNFKGKVSGVDLLLIHDRAGRNQGLV